MVMVYVWMASTHLAATVVQDLQEDSVRLTSMNACLILVE